jgi:DNA-binding transcriptional MerR regulator
VIGSATLCERAGITYRQLDYWIRNGLIKPVDPTPGHGVPRYFRAPEARIAVTMGHLVAAGMDPRQARPLAEKIEKTGKVRIGSLEIVRVAA